MVVALMLGVLLPALNAQTRTIHPTGLATLHENTQGIPNIAATSSYSAAALPSSVDLSPLAPHPGDQGSLGSCVAFAVAYADKTYQECLNWNLRPVGTTNIWSQSHIYNQVHLFPQADGGNANIVTAIKLMCEQGCTTWADMPYDGNDYGWSTRRLKGVKP